MNNIKLAEELIEVISYGASHSDVVNMLSKMNSWQPIKTAPRDGTRIIAWCGDYADVCFIPYAYGEDRWMTDSRISFGGWEEPTHWMPLPDKPE